MNEDKFEVVVTLNRRIYPRYGASYEGFGIFSVNVKETDNWDLIERNELQSFNEITLKGNMPDLEMGKLYTAMVSKRKDPKYGVGYEVKFIYMDFLATKDGQRDFLSSVLTEFQSKSLIEAYPDANLIEMISKDEIDLSIVKGIGEVTFQKIKEKIAENEKYKRAIIKLAGEFEIPYQAIVRMSDKYGSPDILLDRVTKNPYILTEIDGFGFKRVDEMALKMGIAKDSSHRIVSCAEYILHEQSNEGHSWMKSTRLINESIKLLDLRISTIEDALIAERSMHHYSIDDGKIYLDRNFFYENEIVSNVFRLLEAKFEYKAKNIEEAILEVEERQKFSFTDEQKTAIRYAISHNVVIVNGKAGTGKTSTIKGIVEVLKTIEGLEYATCALSGKASQRIQESTGLDSYTIHRLYGYSPTMGWAYNDNNKLERDIIILDEASMVNSELFYYILRAIKCGAKLIITGDVAQLEPIGVGNVLVDLIESNKIPKVELTVVHRQAQMSGILSCANKVREGKRFLNDNEYGFNRLGELQDLYSYTYNNGEDVYRRVMAIAEKYNGNVDVLDFQIIAPMKTKGINSSRNINQACQKVFNQDPNKVDENNKIERKSFTLLEGDKVIINGNNYQKNIFNGTIGIIKYIVNNSDCSGGEKGEYVVCFEGIGDIRLSRSEMNDLDLAYCITVHKSQGSQWKYVLFAMDYSSYIMLNRQLTYTAMTRASRALFLVAELKALQFSIDTNRSTKRRTFLPVILGNK